MKTRRQAAMELLPLYNAMETRKITLGTLARKMYKCGDCWRCCGVGYDYTVLAGTGSTTIHAAFIV